MGGGEGSGRQAIAGWGKYVQHAEGVIWPFLAILQSYKRQRMCQSIDAQFQSSGATKFDKGRQIQFWGARDVQQTAKHRKRAFRAVKLHISHIGHIGP